MDEKKLLNRLRRGDPYALEKLMDRYLPYVATVVWNIVRGTLQPEDAEELVSDVFLAAWTHADALEPGHTRGWLGTAAASTAPRWRQEAHAPASASASWTGSPAGLSGIT